MPVFKQNKRTALPPVREIADNWIECRDTGQNHFQQQSTYQAFLRSNNQRKTTITLSWKLII
jgi:hypothetical protein